MEGGLSDRALKMLRTVLHEKVGMDLDEVPDPALVANQISLAELACLRGGCGVCGLINTGGMSAALRARRPKNEALILLAVLTTCALVIFWTVVRPVDLREARNVGESGAAQARQKAA